MGEHPPDPRATANPRTPSGTDDGRPALFRRRGRDRLRRIQREQRGPRIGPVRLERESLARVAGDARAQRRV